MRLNTKIALILVVPMLLLVGAMAAVIHSEVMSRFLALEKAQQEQNHHRLIEAIEAELGALERLTVDWAVYDETYSFMKGENPEFVDANMAEATFENLQLNGILIFDLEYRTRSQRGFDREANRFADLDIGLVSRVADSLRQRKNSEIFQGILEYQGRVAQLAFSPIQDSNAELDPNGYLVMLRFLDQGEVDLLAQRIRLSLNFMPLRGPGSSDIPQDALDALKSQPLWLRHDSDSQASSFSMLDDLSGEPTLLMQATMPRDIYREGRATARQLIGFTFLALIAFVIGSFYAIRHVALKRLSRMSRRLVALGSSATHGERLPVEGSDEITRVARSVNAMLEGLDKAFEERRRAGERQRELNALLVRIATDEAIAHGDAGALFQVLGGSLHAGASLDSWSLWLSREDDGRFDCLRASNSESQCSIDDALLQAHVTPLAPPLPDSVEVRFTDGEGHHGLLFPFALGARRGALCAEALRADSLQEADERNFLIAATRLIENSLHTHFQNLREQALREKAELDSLTGLGNRSMFEGGLRRALDLAVGSDRLVGVLFVDLDRFKPINDTHGHAVGDWLLCEVARRLRDRVRADDLVARLGGDEFTIVLTALRSPEDARRVAQKVSEALAEPFDHAVGRLQAGASIGLAWSPEHGVGVADLVHAADQAMYAAKQAGRGCWFAADGSSGRPSA
ncbi:MAG TPA: diguanylate cyclase [Arenimonas sp.]|nr:diguanylate cyclase [Arenimonas sp.]